MCVRDSTNQNASFVEWFSLLERGSFENEALVRFRDLGASFSRFGCFVLQSSFSSVSFSKLPLERAVFRGICGVIFALFYSKLVLVISTLYSRGKFLEHFILIAVALVFNILSWAFVTILNCSVMCKPPWWFECYFLLSPWIHCWLLLAVLSDYFGHLVTSTFLLWTFGVYPGLFKSVLEWRDCLSQKELPANGLSNLPKRKPTWSE